VRNIRDNIKNRINKNKNDGREHISKKNLIKIGFHIWRQFDDQYYTGFAAQIAYFFFMASMPTMIVLSQVLGIFDISLDFIKDWLNAHVNSPMSNFVIGLFSATSVKFTNVMMVIVAIWSASSLEFSLGRLESHVLTNGTYRFRYFSERFKSIPTALLSITAIAFSLVIYVYGEEIFSRLLKNSAWTKFLIAVRLPMAAGLFFAMILVNYYLLPRIKVPIHALLPGAIFAWIGIMIVTFFYSVYISNTSNYNILYGAFANIVALMLWFYLISWVLCLGMMFNKAWDEIMKRNVLTQEKMMEYLKVQLADTGEDYKNFFIHDDDILNPELDTIAVKMSKQFVDGFEDEVEERQRAVELKKELERRTAERYKEFLEDDYYDVGKDIDDGEDWK